MRTTEAFIVGTIVGGVAVWLWGRDIEGYIGERVRARSGGDTTLRRAEGVLHDTKERVGAVLRAGQDPIRPAPPSREA